MIAVPGHPFARYHVGPDPTGAGVVLIRCACDHCGGYYERRCQRPELANAYVLRFAQIHAHGLRAQLRP